MQTIGPWSGSDNNGGGCYLLLVQHDHVEHVPVPTSETVPPMVLLPDKEFLAVVPTEGTLFFRETPETDSGHESYSVALGLTLPKNHPDRLAFQLRCKGKRFIAVYVDRNESAVMIGNSSQPIKLEFGRDFGAEFSDFNHIQIGAAQSFAYPAPFYLGFEAQNPGEITIPGSPQTGGGTAVLMQGRYAYDGTYGYMGTAPLTAQESDPVWNIRRLLFDLAGTLQEDLTATGVNWTDYSTHTYT